MCEQSKHDQALPPFEDYDLTDADNVFYIEAKELLKGRYFNRLNIFVKWASGCHYDFAKDIEEEHPEWIEPVTYNIGEDEARTIATTILEDHNDAIMSRLESGVITSKMDY